ncbi:MAG: hypothetical protein Q4A05_11470 [Ruminococcus sp.]|nr:hypothetical protein [Ruminococcus sp.]
MKNENIGNSDLEKVLKDKMNELSDSVDCFDKISARAFPEKDPNFSESGYTVSDLENVTGRPEHGKILRWAALAAAVVLCIVFVPKTGIVRHILSNLGGGVKHDFTQIVEEIDAETELHQYQQLDVPLEYYLKNDVLVTPLFSCPFEDSGKEDAMVRIFIRETGAGQFTNFDTAQVYAVEYIGEYSEENIIAAAKSIYSFTDADLEEPRIRSGSIDFAGAAVTLNFAPDKDNEYLHDKDGDAVSVANQSYGCYIMYDGKTVWTTTSVLYGHKGTGYSEEYFYDTVTAFGGEIISLPDRQAMWEESLYYDGTSALPKETGSNFTRTELFPSGSFAYEDVNNYGFVGNFNDFSVDMAMLRKSKEIKLSSSRTDSTISTIAAPSDPDLLYGLSIYYAFEHLADESEYDEHGNAPEYHLEVYCDETMLTSVPLNQYAYNRRKTNEEIEKEREALAELEAAKETMALDQQLLEYENKNLELTQKLNSDLNGWENRNISDDIEFNNSMIQEIERLKAKLAADN